MLAGIGFADPSRISEEMVDVFTTCAQQYGAEHAILNFQAGRFSLSMEERLASLTQPVALLWGERCAFPPLDWAYRLQPLAKQATLHIIPDAGALANLEASADVSEILGGLLSTDLRVMHAG
jgi:pimeloyl-ACP methyl ester carboxylesterase